MIALIYGEVGVSNSSKFGQVNVQFTLQVFDCGPVDLSTCRCMVHE
jgi:hypothetical protein